MGIAAAHSSSIWIAKPGRLWLPCPFLQPADGKLGQPSPGLLPAPATFTIAIYASCSKALRAAAQASATSIGSNSIEGRRDCLEIVLDILWKPASACQWRRKRGPFCRRSANGLDTCEDPTASVAGLQNGGSANFLVLSP